MEYDQMFYELLYKKSITLNFKTGSYNYIPLIFMSGLKKDDDERMFFKYDETVQYKANFLKLAEYFWMFYDKIPEKQREFLTKFQRKIPDNYLCHHEISPFYRGPVTLMFAGEIQGRSRNYYPEEMNCILLSHHLREMG